MSYRELKTQEEIAEALLLVDAWKHPDLPAAQWAANLKEYSELREGGNWLASPPFRAFIEVMRYANLSRQDKSVKLLDIGCSSGQYSQVMKYGGLQWNYTGVDYSPAFKEFAKKVYPDVYIEVGDATSLDWPHGTFDMVVSGCVLLHMEQWQLAIHEAARVSKQYVLFHRTPMLKEKPTTYWMKDAYGVPCFEVWFNMWDFRQELLNAGLRVVHVEPVFVTPEHGGYGHYSILTEKRT